MVIWNIIVENVMRSWVLMKIKPRIWEFAGDYCCYTFKTYAEDEIPEFATMRTDSKNVFFRGMKITNCPFCGKTIVLEKEVI